MNQIKNIKISKRIKSPWEKNREQINTSYEILTNILHQKSRDVTENTAGFTHIPLILKQAINLVKSLDWGFVLEHSAAFL